MGNLFSSKSLFSAVFGNVRSYKYFSKKPTIRVYSEVDFAKIALRPDNSDDVHFTVISRYDKEGQRHQVLYEKNFVNILREAEKWPNLESESECEGLNWSSEEEAVVDRKWLSWRKAQRSIHS